MFISYRNILINIVLIFALVIENSICHSSSILEVELESENADLIKPNAFTIHNNSSNSLVFYFSYDGGKIWNEKKLGENKVYEYSINTLKKVMIKVPTQNKGSVRYWLEPNRRYQIYWNDSQKIWDIIELSAR
jgi:hypothetical protein